MDSRLDSIGAAVGEFAFHALDGEIDWTGKDAGAVAAAVERAFRRALCDVGRCDCSERPHDRSALSQRERDRLAALWHIYVRPLTVEEEAERRRLELLEYGRDVSGSESR